MRPTATFSVPETAVGVRQRTLSSFVFGTTCTHSCAAVNIDSISFSGISRFNLKVRAWLWQRIVPTRTQIPSTGTGGFRPRILFVSAIPFHSSLLCPPGISLSIQGSTLPASGAPNSAVGNPGDRCKSNNARSASSAFSVGDFRCGSVNTYICFTNSSIFAAPPPDAA